MVGKGIIINNSKYPVRFNYLQSVLSSASYTVTIPGWYRIHVVGSGGTGGQGGRARTGNDRTGTAISSGGSSGSTGAYAIHDVFLPYGTQIITTISSTESKVIVLNNTVIAKNGVNGNKGNEMDNGVSSPDAADAVEPNSAAGATASGGSVINISAVPGNPSKYVYRSRIDTWSDGGEGSYIPYALAAYTPKTNTPSGENAPSSSILLGGAGAGGNGIATDNTSWRDGKPGGIGGIGGVVIERGVYV